MPLQCIDFVCLKTPDSALFHEALDQFDQL